MSHMHMDHSLRSQPLDKMLILVLNGAPLPSEPLYYAFTHIPSLPFKITPRMAHEELIWISD